MLIICPRCEADNFISFGHSTYKGEYKKRWRCKNCGKIVKEEKDNVRKKYIAKKQEPIFLDKKIPKDLNWRKMFKYFENYKTEHKKADGSQDEATIRISPNERGMAGICFSADWHLGSLFTDYKLLKKNLELILDTDNIYQITVGDLNNNFRKFRSLLCSLTQLASPADQRQLLSAILKEFVVKKKWLCATWGNHDVVMDEQLYGESIIADLLGENFVYFNGKGRLNLLIGDQKYIIEMSHFYPGHSILNPNHALGRQLRHYSPDADVIVQGHLHLPSAQWYYYSGRRINLIEVGGFNPDDNYFKRFWEASRFGVPVVIFHSDRHECVNYPSLEEWLEK